MSKFVLAVGIVIKPDQVGRFMAMLLENARATRETEAGCRTFDVLVDPKDRTRVMLYEVYDDEAAFDAHQRTAHFQKYIAEAVPLLQSRDRYVFHRAAP
jgi:autoinducer 2-degrading protein